MPFDILGRIIFPRLQPWERKRKAKLIIGVVAAALIGAACTGLMIYKQNSSNH
ncbi:MAG: hypothetical protein RL616_1630 [Verrucomicrobiota bacterium]